MFKQILIYALLTILVVVFSHYVYLAVYYVDVFVTSLSMQLRPIFAWSDNSFGIAKTLVLIFVPVLITSIPALIYRLYKKQTMPHFIAIAWCIWWILVLGSVLIR